MALQTNYRQRALGSTMSSIIAFKASFDPEKKSLPFFITYLNEGWAGREMVVVATINARGMLQRLLWLRLLKEGR